VRIGASLVLGTVTAVLTNLATTSWNPALTLGLVASVAAGGVLEWWTRRTGPETSRTARVGVDVGSGSEVSGGAARASAGGTVQVTATDRSVVRDSTQRAAGGSIEVHVSEGSTVTGHEATTHE
jgi:hypothetical protein